MTVDASRITVLMYHRVGATGNDWERRYGITPEGFAAHMRHLRNLGMQAVSLADFLAWLDGQCPLPEGSFLLTFDDGYRGVHDHAAPVLLELGWPAVVFLVSDLLGASDDWCRAENPDRRAHALMGPTEIRDLQGQGFSFQSHTRTHPDLTRLDDDRLAAELSGSRLALQELLDTEVTCLAYPYGRQDARVVEAARNAGYSHGFSTQPGFNRRSVMPLLIRRLDITGTDTPRMLERKIRYGSNDGSLRQQLRYYRERLIQRFLP